MLFLLHLPQVTYAEKIEKVADGKAVITRRIESGVETVEAPLPLVVTVNGSADDCRPRNARRIQKYKYAVTPSEKATMSETLSTLVLIFNSRSGVQTLLMRIQNKLA